MEGRMEGRKGDVWKASKLCVGALLVTKKTTRASAAAVACSEKNDVAAINR